MMSDLQGQQAAWEKYMASEAALNETQRRLDETRAANREILQQIDALDREVAQGEAARAKIQALQSQIWAPQAPQLRIAGTSAPPALNPPQPNYNYPPSHPPPQQHAYAHQYYQQPATQGYEQQSFSVPSGSSSRAGQSHIHPSRTNNTHSRTYPSVADAYNTAAAAHNNLSNLKAPSFSLAKPPTRPPSNPQPYPQTNKYTINPHSDVIDLVSPQVVSEQTSDTRKIESLQASLEQWASMAAPNTYYAITAHVRFVKDGSARACCAISSKDKWHYADIATAAQYILRKGDTTINLPSSASSATTNVLTPSTTSQNVAQPAGPTRSSVPTNQHETPNQTQPQRQSQGQHSTRAPLFPQNAQGNPLPQPQNAPSTSLPSTNPQSATSLAPHLPQIGQPHSSRPLSHAQSATLQALSSRTQETQSQSQAKQTIQQQPLPAPSSRTAAVSTVSSQPRPPTIPASQGHVTRPQDKPPHHNQPGPQPAPQIRPLPPSDPSQNQSQLSQVAGPSTSTSTPQNPVPARSTQPHPDTASKPLPDFQPARFIPHKDSFATVQGLQTFPPSRPRPSGQGVTSYESVGMDTLSPFRYAPPVLQPQPTPAQVPHGPLKPASADRKHLAQDILRNLLRREIAVPPVPAPTQAQMHAVTAQKPLGPAQVTFTAPQASGSSLSSVQAVAPTFTGPTVSSFSIRNDKPVRTFIPYAPATIVPPIQMPLPITTPSKPPTKVLIPAPVASQPPSTPNPNVPPQTPLFLPSPRSVTEEIDEPMLPLSISRAATLNVDEDVGRRSKKRKMFSHVLIPEAPPHVKRDMLKNAMLVDFVQGSSTSLSVVKAEDTSVLGLRLKEQSRGALRELPCLWEGCDATLNSANALTRHLQRHAATHLPDQMVSRRCRWADCRKRLSKGSSHVQRHGKVPLYCPYLNCEGTFESSRALLDHTSRHRKDKLRPTAALSRLAAPETLPDAPLTIPSYRHLPIDVAACPIPADRHQAMAPWVHSRTRGPVRKPKKHNAVPEEASYDFAFLSKRTTFSSSPSRPAKIRGVADVESVEMTKMVAGGRVFLDRQSEELWDATTDVDAEGQVFLDVQRVDLPAASMDVDTDTDELDLLGPSEP